MVMMVMMVMILALVMMVMKDEDERMPSTRSSKYLRRVLARGAGDVGQDRESMRLSKVCHIHGIDTAVKQDASMSMGLGRWYL